MSGADRYPTPFDRLGAAALAYSSADGESAYLRATQRLRKAALDFAESPATRGKRSTGRRALMGVLLEVAAERKRQDELHGFQPDLPHGCGSDAQQLILTALRSDMAGIEAAGDVTFADLLLEEVAEVLAEPDDAKRRAELLQVAALCVKSVQRMDARRE